MVTAQSHQRHPLCRFAALPPKGAARKAPLKGELAAPTGLTEGFRSRHPLPYEIPGEFVGATLAPQWGSWQPVGLTCAPAGAMQASNRRQAALSESQRGCDSLNGYSSKSPTTPPLPLRGTSPRGGSEGLYEFALGFQNGILCTANPSATLTRGPPPLSGEVILSFHRRRPGCGRRGCLFRRAF